jgi:flagellin-like protein
MFPLLVYLKVTGFVNELKKDERGLSGVVVAIMLVVVAILAVVLLWSLLGDSIRTWWEDLVNGADVPQ